MSAAETPTIFENTTQGWVGAIKIRRNGDRDSVAVAPGDRIELTAEEQMLTANAPRDPDNSPFVEKPYTDYDEKGDIVSEGVRPALAEVKAEDRPIPATANAETPSEVDPGAEGGEDEQDDPGEDALGAAPEGKRDPKEIVGA